MNARVFLLVVVTGLFMAAWNDDQAARQQFLAQRARLRAAQTVAAADTAASQVQQQRTSLQTSVHSVVAAQTTRPVVSQFRADGMAPGSYRAVSEHGVTFEVTIDNAAVVNRREFYVADDPQGVRWYFVRIQPGA